MSKIDRNWRIGCENGRQMNMVWAVLKDAGEPVLADEPYYTKAHNPYRVMAFNEVGQKWWGSFNPNVTFREFMTIMKPENKKDVQYITNLLDYLDKPELIQHVNGGHVRALHYFPNKSAAQQVLVVFEDGKVTDYYKNGKFDITCRHSWFILKPKPKEYVTGWRRRVIYEDGSQILDLVAKPTKEEFMECYKQHLTESRFGPWEEVITEVCDEL